MTSPSKQETFEPFVTQARRTEFRTILPPSAVLEFRDIVDAQDVCEVSKSANDPAGVTLALSLADDQSKEIEALKLQVSDLEARLATTAANCEARVEALRNSLSTQLADQFLVDVKREMQQVEARLGDAISDILGPFVEGAVRLKILESFVQETASLLGSGSIVALEIKAPAMLHSLLIDKFRLAGIEVQTQCSEMPEIKIEVNGTVISTRLAHWSGLLANGAT